MSVFQKLWLGAFLGTTANFALYLMLAAEVYRATGSALLSSLMFAAQWILPILLVLRIEQAGRILAPRALMLSASLAFVVLTALAAACAPATAPLIGLCMLFGALDALVKSGRLIALKRYFDAERQRTAVSALASAMYVGSSLGGALFALVPEQNAVIVVAGGGIAAHLLAALVFARLPAPAAAPSVEGAAAHSVRAFAGALRQAASEPRVFEALFCLILVCGAFQGFHNIARTALPLGHLDAGSAEVGILQVISGGAIIAGVVLYRWLFAARDGLAGVAGQLGYLCAGLLLATTLMGGVAASFAVYFAFILAFEFLFMHYQTRLVVAVEVGKITVVSAFQYAILNLAMLVTILAGGTLTDTLGLTATAAVFAVGFCVLFLTRGAVTRAAARAAAGDPAPAR